MFICRIGFPRPFWSTCAFVPVILWHLSKRLVLLWNTSTRMTTGGLHRMRHNCTALQIDAFSSGIIASKEPYTRLLVRVNVLQLSVNSDENITTKGISHSSHNWGRQSRSKCCESSCFLKRKGKGWHAVYEGGENATENRRSSAIQVPHSTPPSFQRITQVFCESVEMSCLVTQRKHITNRGVER